MKIIGTDDRQSIVLVSMSQGEWDIMRRMAGVPYDKASHAVGTAYSTAVADEILTAFTAMKEIRRGMTKLYNDWTKHIEAVDRVLGTVKAPD